MGILAADRHKGVVPLWPRPLPLPGPPSLSAQARLPVWEPERELRSLECSLWPSCTSTTSLRAVWKKANCPNTTVEQRETWCGDLRGEDRAAVLRDGGSPGGLGAPDQGQGRLNGACWFMGANCLLSLSTG